MIDAAAIWLPPKPAIIIQREIPELRLVVDDEDAGHMVPADFRAMPWALRQTVPVHELRKMLPEPYRLLGHGLILSLLGGLPGPMMAGGVKYAWLFTSNGTMTIPGDWNRDDNAWHAVGKGGNGRQAQESTLVPNTYFGGGGGGGGSWAGNYNRVYAFGQQLAVTVSSDVSIASDLIAKAGGDGGALSGGTSSGGQGGQASASTGDFKNNGGNGLTVSGSASTRIGGGAGGAGGPNGAGVNGATGGGGRGDAGQGGFAGQFGEDGYPGWGEFFFNAPFTVPGWNPGHPVNVGSGGGGGPGSDNTPAERPGGDGGLYGAGGGGGGGGAFGSPEIGSGGTGAQGCALVVNNPSL